MSDSRHQPTEQTNEQTLTPAQKKEEAHKQKQVRPNEARARIKA